MKKFLYFAATVLSLSVIFGSGWAAGTGKTAAPVYTIAPEQRVIVDPPSDGDKLPDEPGGHVCPKDGKGESERDNGGECEKKFEFKFKIPSPADFRDRFTRLPHFN